jgi:hypothetical protein
MKENDEYKRDLAEARKKTMLELADIWDAYTDNVIAKNIARGKSEVTVQLGMPIGFVFKRILHGYSSSETIDVYKEAQHDLAARLREKNIEFEMNPWLSLFIWSYGFNLTISMQK